MVAAKARGASDPRVRGYARMTLGGLSRGGTHGDEIRHGILNIMRDYGIREGNRPVSRGVFAGSGVAGLVRGGWWVVVEWWWSAVGMVWRAQQLLMGWDCSWRLVLVLGAVGVSCGCEQEAWSAHQTRPWSNALPPPFQGLDEPWLEQWHQKLHQNTTPEDVAIAGGSLLGCSAGWRRRCIPLLTAGHLHC